MARESCNLDKEEAEILKASSPSPASPPPAVAAASASPPSPLLKLASKPPIQRPGRPETPRRRCHASCDRERRRPEERGIPPQSQSAGRCSSCQRRVGLTGFRCRCGDLFCLRHRHSDTHECSFDYKAAGREEISKANPLIRPAKIIKI